MNATKSLGILFGSRTQTRFLQRKTPCFRQRYLTFTQSVHDAAKRIQIFISHSMDPYLNLSIENYLLERSPSDSVILFLYANQPCIVIGRNQNPWIEINMSLLHDNSSKIPIVRRRSGGGTVFHDDGNVNYCVISPTSGFNRGKHANMVAQALKLAKVRDVYVNDRYDLVLEKVENNEEVKRTYKISGSAYKLTRSRSLHHGTCLLSSPNLKNISRYLDAPAKSLIKARGVASVRSKIANVGISNIAFQEAVVEEFCQMYSTVSPVFVGDELKENPDIVRGYTELKSNDWIYCQTPQFTFSIDGSSKDPVDSSKTIREVWDLPSSFHEKFTARNGQITSASISLSSFSNKYIHEINDWRPNFPIGNPKSMNSYQQKLGTLLNNLFGRRRNSI